VFSVDLRIVLSLAVFRSVVFTIRICKVGFSDCSCRFVLRDRRGVAVQGAVCCRQADGDEFSHGSPGELFQSALVSCSNQFVVADLLEEIMPIKFGFYG
jgi:hypothetical protein